MPNFQNPVISGFHPDPSICLVDGTFYLVTSSFEYFPGLPLFCSKDLVNWRQIGHVLDRESQLDLVNARPSGGLYAPTIRYHAGRFYVTCTNVSSGGNFIVHTENPTDGWSEPVWIEQDGIDPSLFFEDGVCYFTSTVEPEPGKPHELRPDFTRGVQQCVINPDTGDTLTDSRFLWGGTGGMYPEAPHIYRRGGYYYLILAEGGTHAGHMVTVGRSESLWGPWEPCPMNPVLSHRSLPSPIQNVGHADLIELDDGSWWAVVLGTRPHDQVHVLGRETFLVPVSWTSDGWPDMGTVSELEAAPITPLAPLVKHWGVDRFDSPRLAPYWSMLRRPLTEDEMELAHGALILRGRTASADDPLLTAVLRRQQHHDMRVEAELEFHPTSSEEAGLTIRADEFHHIDLAVRLEGGVRIAELRYRIGPVKHVLAFQEVTDATITLGIESTATAYTLEVNGQVLGTVPSRYVSAEVAQSFTGVFLGMYATGPRGAPARWFHFAYSPQEQEPSQ